MKKNEMAAMATRGAGHGMGAGRPLRAEEAGADREIGVPSDLLRVAAERSRVYSPEADGEAKEGKREDPLPGPPPPSRGSEEEAAFTPDPLPGPPPPSRGSEEEAAFTPDPLPGPPPPSRGSEEEAAFTPDPLPGPPPPSRGREEEAFGARVRARRNELGLTLTDVARRAGCRESYLSMIETGRRPPPGEELLRALEVVLLLDAGQLVENARWLATPASVRRQVEALQDRSRRTDALIEQLRRGPRDLDAMLKSGQLQRLVESHVANVEPLGAARQAIPIVNKVAAGYPRDFTDMGYPARVADEYLACPDVMVAEDSQAFAARVVGDSMEPEYHEGDTVVFSPDAPTPAGCDCFVRLEPDGETTFKRVFFEGDECEYVRLEPLNSAYRARRVHREEIAGMYAAVYVMRPVGRA